MHNFTNLDLNSLEGEWLRQPRLYDKYAEQLADAKLDLAEAKAALEATEALVKQRIRNEPSKYNLKSRPTEGAIKEAVVLSKRYQEAVKLVNNTKHRVDILDGVINTLEHRKRTLENLVTLHGQNYFSKPRSGDSMSGASFRRKRKK